MENANKGQSPENGKTPTSKVSTTPTASPQGEHPAVKEGNPAQQRPEYGADAGPNTSSRDDQLPSLDDPGAEGERPASEE